MRRLLCLLLLVLALPASATGLLDNRPSSTLGSINNSADFLPVREAFQLSLVESTPQSIKLRFVATEGYYLYRHRFQFRADPADVGLGAAQLPDGEKKHDEYFGDVEVYHGILDVELPRTNQRPFTLAVTYQGCADKGLCYPPETERLSIEGNDKVVADKVATTTANWSWRELALFFLAGIGLTFTPCVLPMLPILSGVVLRGQVGGVRGFNLSLAYVLSMAACFALLGALMGMFGAQLNLQARLQSAWVLVPFATFFAVFALAMFGVFELKLPHAISHRLHHIAGRTEGGSLWGAAVLGVVSSLLVSPCVSAPLAGALLYISASGDAFGGGLKLFLLGLGMGTPLLLVATGGAAWLPKSGPWLVYVKNAIGVLLLALAIALLSRVLPGQVTLLLVGLLLGGVGLFLGALEFVYKPPRKRLGQLLGLFLLFYAMACWYGAFSGQSDLLNPLGRTAVVATGNQPQSNSAWQTVSTPADLDRVLAEAKASGTPLLLDWYADWCISCKVIEHEVLNDAKVVERLKDYRLIRFDITASNAEQRTLLDRYTLFGPPALMFFGRDGVERADVRVIGEINATDFAERVAKANDRI
ncbi:MULTISPECIES: protein-disulfide reductase DsbD [unclassified Pseudomonas]|uniref:protein-disulfide reductase DsbD n=1 Tax=unclassified Pseudomonas TaxID=196821 RepID=UPI0019149C66|nr:MULTISPECIES: protein-disulfide reductase DsbD [unclassified Pseudomonas]MBK5549795.1 protein-disulfide reductase DsbD [Pseudomonas sp. TH03]MEB0226848.1 protein-disulfide reductase DsbD [Pseudomonas sp. 5S1]MEB0293852.1 protein-disulfide reductase DsbD [Pseudomonas sp. 10S4]